MSGNNGFIDFENMIENSGTAKSVTTSDHSSKEEEMLKDVIIKNNAKTETDILYKSAQDENQKLMLRNNVVQGSYADDMKIKILDLLDGYVKEELKEEIILADSVKEIKKEKSNLLLGAVGIVVIGFITSVFFPIAWIIGIVLAIVGYVSGKKECETKMQSAVTALEKVEKFRKAGYRI